ncbi:hypothetical protein LTR64_001165 [Lithohypha guttulata]|uniref:uncharacterized protein n=1 Tax=Lithohypha guttulata TaxID=1690604 RepID=UPI002DDDDF3D|nr:hypothetical protein LTR51_003359 [Lithohypha guttulata]
MTSILRHPLLGLIRGNKLTSTDLVQYCGLPYGTIPQRFSRSTTLQELPTTSSSETFDATKTGPECIQPEGAVKLDCESNQFPNQDFEEPPQSENCLYLNVVAPESQSTTPLPVLVFLHGGAFLIGSSSRPYYTPTNFVKHAFSTNRPHIFVSINFRLGALGFLHSSEVSSLIPPNNGLHDQLRAFEWIHRNISGFNGDPERITAIGQSAGGESVSLHTISGNETPLFKQVIAFSGSPVTMPSKTPEGHQENFLELADKLGVKDIKTKTSEQIAQEFIDAPISKIRELSFVGAPCSSSEMLPYDKPTMALTYSKPESNVKWLKRAIYSSCTYDGSISYNMMSKSGKKDNAKSFIDNANENMSKAGAQELSSIYGIEENDSDPAALKKGCQFESDIGFFAASLAEVQGSPAEKRFLQLFDLKNPFKAGGALPEKEAASHTWDIVALLGKYDDLLDEKTLKIVKEWRGRILNFVCEEDDPWIEWDEETGNALRIGDEDLKMQQKSEYMDEDGQRRKRLLELAEREKGEQGWDHLWEGVCRKWLD